ncbi:ABC transporter ATP-binding protein [Actinophytocola xinjiangensis]|uniref:ABC transporter ATP-binding protein n=1 Tax=Actinophytocola xinjiangensis TaxID=485602 RepID=A0A7Z0WFK9_9PSEU|nr:ABC transporter ATP-binding protein [Actinophytocola xinjiangensis]OLF05676.1 ABC transporter ATP-binding protein [Actinophytocola xinjiangensis]
MRLAFDEVTAVLDGREIVRRLSLEVPSGQVVGLVGPNGSGKSTAVRCVYRALRPTTGTIWLGRTDLASMSRKDSARSVAALTQHNGLDLDFTVEEVVALGRAPHHTGNQRLGARERALCHTAMERLDVAHLATRGVLSLSGGERQRVLIARALAQEPQVLVLDEPTNHLDIRHQAGLLVLLRDLGLTVLVVLHDLNLAAATCDRLGVLSEGRLVASGTPHEVLTEALVREVFGTTVTIVHHRGVPQLLHSLPERGSLR